MIYISWEKCSFIIIKLKSDDHMKPKRLFSRLYNMAVCLDSLLLDMSGPCASQPVHILLIRLEVIDDLCLCVCGE